VGYTWQGVAALDGDGLTIGQRGSKYNGTGKIF